MEMNKREVELGSTGEHGRVQGICWEYVEMNMGVGNEGQEWWSKLGPVGSMWKWIWEWAMKAKSGGVN